MKAVRFSVQTRLAKAGCFSESRPKRGAAMLFRAVASRSGPVIAKAFCYSGCIDGVGKNRPKLAGRRRDAFHGLHGKFVLLNFGHPQFYCQRLSLATKVDGFSKNTRCLLVRMKTQRVFAADKI